MKMAQLGGGRVSEPNLFSLGWSRFVLHLILRGLFSQTTCWCHLCWVRMKRKVASCWSLGQKTRKAARWMWKDTKPHGTAAPAHVPLHLRGRLGMQNKAETNRKQNNTHKDNETNTDTEAEPEPEPETEAKPEPHRNNIFWHTFLLIHTPFFL